MMMRFFLLLLLAWPVLSHTQTEYFTIRDYKIDVTFTEQGYADFEEVITVEFTQPRHGIFRFIPYRDIINGHRVDRIFQNVKVENFKVSKSRENNNLVLKIGDANKYVDGIQTYKINYRVLNPLNFFEEHTEFYWDLLGVSWPVEIDNISFRIRMPQKVRLEISDVGVSTGDAGLAGGDVEFEVFPQEITGKSTRKFMPGEGLTMAIKLAKEDFQPMSFWTSFMKLHSLLLAPLIFLFLGITARFVARNRKLTIMTEYFPPVGLSPAVAGGFVDHSVDNSDVLCLIPHLANMGYLRLEAQEEKGFFSNKSNITFYKLKDEGPELKPFESEFFNALFAFGDRVELDSLKEKFHTHLSSVQASVREWIKAQGWYEADQKTLGCITGLAGMIALAWGAYAIFMKQNLDGIALVLTGFLLFYFTGKFNKRTISGNETYRKLEGFRQFVAKAERPVIERLMKDDPLYYDKTMPFALAFGYLKQWNRQFDGLLMQPPSWYSGPIMYGHGMTNSWNTFSESFPSEINNIGSVFSSAPSSSGSGGGGGGGFSGGGSGGGGGGSW